MLAATGGALAIAYSAKLISNLIHTLKAEPIGTDLYLAQHSDDEPLVLRQLRLDTWVYRTIHYPQTLARNTRTHMHTREYKRTRVQARTRV